MLPVFIWSFALFAPSFAISCYSSDTKTGANQTCFGQFCTYSKHSQKTPGNDSVPVIAQGCYNWTLGSHKRIGCYKVYGHANGLQCYCDQNFCNTEQMINSTPINTANTYTCYDSATEGTCEGYACIAKFLITLEYHNTVKRQCQEAFHYGRHARISAA